MAIEILPSLLAADFGCLAEEILRAEASGADQLHLDIMDAHFVPNLSFGPDVVALSRRVAPAFKRNVHLMLTRPDLYLEKFAAAGADSIQIHVESDCDVHRELARIRSLGLENAIVLNPETPAERLLPYLREIDGILVMSVHPGYGGQKFIESSLSKIEYLRRMAGPEMPIMVDGGINADTAVKAARAGADRFVAGSYLFARPDMKSAVADLARRCGDASAHA